MLEDKVKILAKDPKMKWSKPKVDIEEGMERLSKNLLRKVIGNE
jgi:hypothetical protein